MFCDLEQARLTVLRNWILERGVTAIQMNERQFWIFAQLLPTAEKPRITFMESPLRVPETPESAQKRLGIFDKADSRAI